MTRPGGWLARVVSLAGVVLVLAGLGLVGWWGVEVRTAPGSPQRGSETPVTALDLRARRAVTSPAVSVDPTNAQFVALATRTDSPGPDCGLHVSGDGAKSWLPVEALDQLPGGVEGCYAGDVDFDGMGRLVFSFLGMAGSPPEPVGLYAVSSDDNAQAFTQPRRLADLATTGADVAVGAERLHAVWLEAANGDSGEEQAGWPVGGRVVAASGDYGGLGEPLVVDGPEEGLVAAPTVAADVDGEAVAVAYYQLPAEATTEGGVSSLTEQAGPWRLMVATANSDGAFHDPVEVAAFKLPAVEAEPPVRRPRLVSGRGIAAPGLAARGDRLCAAWTDAGEQGQLAAWVRCSREGGQTWQEPAQLGGGLGGALGQWLPQVALTSDAVEAAFYSSHADTDAPVADVYYATESPGDGFGTPLRLSSRSSQPPQAPRPSWYGTRVGLATVGKRTVAAWADSRNAIPRLFPSQEVFAAVLATPAEAAGPPVWLGSGLMAGGLGVLGGALGWRRASRRRARDGDQEEAVQPGAKPVILLLVVASGLAAAGCSGGQAGEPLPPSAPTVEVRLLDNDLAFEEPVPAGRVVFRVENAGEAVHQLALLPLPEDFPPIHEELANDTPRSVRSFARVPSLQPGETGMFAADLAPEQRYALVDFSESSEGRMHAKLGVAAEFRTKGEGPMTGAASSQLGEGDADQEREVSVRERTTVRTDLAWPPDRAFPGGPAAGTVTRTPRVTGG